MNAYAAFCYSPWRQTDKYTPTSLGLNGLIVMELKLVESAVKPGFFKQNGMGADIQNSAMIHNDNFVRLKNGRKTVRNGDHCTSVS